jgi:hypothetical protein
MHSAVKNRPAVGFRAGEKLTVARFAQNELAGAPVMLLSRRDSLKPDTFLTTPRSTT